MKKSTVLGLALAAIFSSLSQVQAQTTLAGWDFESFSTTVNGTSGPIAFTQNTTSAAGASLNAIAAATGTGSATGAHASTATAWSTPAGNGSANSLSANTWAAGDYYQFQLSTTGYDDVAVAWDQVSSATGPSSFKLQYSTDGVNFTDVSTYVVSASSSVFWGSTASISGTSYSYDLSSDTALDSAPTIYLRLDDLSTVAASGTDRIDNFTVTAQAVPEPASWMLGAIALGAVAFWRLRRSAA